MESNLLRSVKYRVFDELTDSLQQHPTYRDKANVFHKYPYRERPMMGIYLKNASATRIRLSPDDFAGTLKSFVALAKAETYEGVFLDWVWEDLSNLTTYQRDEDLSSQTTGSTTFGENRMFYVTNKPIISGLNNLDIADNFMQVTVTVNGTKVFPEYLNGELGLIVLPTCPTTADTVLVSYWYSNLSSPGRYYLRITDTTHFNVSPLYVVDNEKVIVKTTGTETSADVINQDLYGGFDVLYTRQSKSSHNIYLVRDSDYTIDTDGHIIFLNPLPVGSTLYANYRWVGTVLGPFDIPSQPFHYNNTAIPGVSLIFSNKIIVDDKQVVIVYPNREIAAAVYSGHWVMNFDLEIFARDPIQLPDLTDHIIDDLWSRKREKLVNEGLTIEALEPTGEVEEVYVESTNDQYFKNSVTLSIMTEWKRFKTYPTKLLDINTQLYAVLQNTEIIINSQNEILELNVTPQNKIFEIKYPKEGYPRYL